MKMTPLEPWILEKTKMTASMRESLQQYQLSELLKTLRYAKNRSRFYQERFSDIDIEMIDSFEAFEQIPFTEASDLKERSFDFLCVSQNEIERVVTLNTSGTTGCEKRLFFTRGDLEATVDFFHHGMLCLVDHADNVMVMLPGSTLGSIGNLLKTAMTRARIECVVHGLLNEVEKAVACIEENNITCIVGIPMQIRYLSLIKPELFGTYVKKVLLSTDYVPTALVESLRAKGCLVYNHYGMTEMGYGGGVECGCLNGYHLRENDLYVEIIDPKTHRNVKEGEYGEVVFTAFRRQAMPLIRYKTGDIARFSTTRCACGTFLRTMDKVLGRIDNKIVIENREIYLREFDEILLGFNEVLDYKIDCEAQKTLHVRITLTSLEIFEPLKLKIEKAFQDYFHQTFELTFTAQIDQHSLLLSSSMIKRIINDTQNKEQYHD
jgi:phenylacetate-coenzyme A ligase PaaK-like adenylate-forming protein